MVLTKTNIFMTGDEVIIEWSANEAMDSRKCFENPKFTAGAIRLGEEKPLLGPLYYY